MLLLKTLEETIDHQAKIQNDEFEEIMQKNLHERIRKGYTMTNLFVEIEFFDGTPRFCKFLDSPLRYVRRIKIHSDQNNLKIREGSQVQILNKDYNLSFTMEVEFDGITDFVLLSNDFQIRDNFMNSENYPTQNWELNILNQDVTNKLLKSTLDILHANPQISNFFQYFFEGKYKNEYSKEDAIYSENLSQNEAICKSLFCSYFHLIQGPPGTGKTHTVAKIVSLLVAQGKRVFITGPTHTSINNCLSAISKILKDKTKVVKIGERYQTEEILDNLHITFIKQLRMSEYQNNEKYSQSGIVIGATPYSLCYPASKKLEGWSFDCSIFDEAAQLSVPLALSAMLITKK